MDHPNIGLLEKMEDMRKPSNRGLVIFSPVGDLGQLEGFCSHVRSLGIDKDADFVFVYRQGLSYGASGLSAFHASEKYPLGTSGAFFAGQLLAYSLGYKIIVVADLDAFLDSRATFDALVQIAQEKQVAAAPLSKSPQEQNAEKGYAVMNQWGVFPRKIFEDCGFAIPYTYKGAEDFEFRQRLLHFKKLIVYNGGFALHPKEGMGVFPKLANRCKYFPYIAGLMKAYLFCSAYQPLFLFKYLLWHSYYSFFADAFCEASLLHTLSNPFDLAHLNCLSQTPPNFTLKKIGAKKPANAAASVLSLPALLLFKNAKFSDSEITLLHSRAAFALSLAKATLFIPLRFAQGAYSMFSHKKKTSGLAFPITPKNAQAAIVCCSSLLHA